MSRPPTEAELVQLRKQLGGLRTEPKASTPTAARIVAAVAAAIGMTARETGNGRRWYLVTAGGDLGLDCWLDETSTPGVFVLGPGWTTDERALLLQLTREHRLQSS